VLSSLILAILAGAGLFIFTTGGATAEASDARKYNAGKIIDDSIFTNTNSMSVDDIQRFLDSKVTCDTWGAKTSELGGGTRAQWMAARGISPPFKCINGYYENPNNGQTNYGSNDIPSGAISAAQIIYNYSRQFGINPQVIIVTLQKENGLITDQWPTPKQYSEAMGFGCPDNVAPGAPACDPSYGGFSAQVYEAARHFRGFFDNRAGWFIPFTTGVNYVRWSPNSSCGGSNVNIENRATVALYSYTPYQPNDAAKNAQYGTGDACSAYGNRNFYIYFNDWFGSTQYSSLVRTAENPTVFLVANGTKYPIGDMNTFSALAPMGEVTFVPQSYVDNLANGALMGRVIRSSNGTVYYYDSGIKLPFGSCAQVADYGSSCGQSVLLEDSQLNRFANGPSMTNIVVTSSGKRFYVSGGVKREVYDDQSITQAGISNGVNVLSEGSVAALPYGNPVMRNDVFVKDRQTGTIYLYTGGQKNALHDSLQTTYASITTTKPLDTQSLNLMAQGTQIGGYIKSNAGTNYVLTEKGKLAVSNPGEWSANFMSLSDATLSQIPTVTAVSAPYTVTFSNGGTIYLVANATLRPITSWSGLLSINPNPNILTLPSYYLNDIAQGVVVLTPGSLVLAADNPTVYLVDGLNTLIPMNSFNQVTELGFGPIVNTTTSVLNSYTKAPSVLNAAVQCGSSQGLAIGGVVYPVSLTGASYTTLSTMNCSLLKWSTTAPTFLQATNGTIYEIQSGQKRPIASYGKYISLGGNANNTVRASNYATSFFSDGALLQ